MIRIWTQLMKKSLLMIICTIIYKIVHKNATTLGTETNIKRQKKKTTLRHAHWGIVYPEIDNLTSIRDGFKKVPLYFFNPPLRDP